MPLIVLTVLFQVLCGIHVVRSGRELYWLWIIIMVPLIGCIIYLLAVVLPDLMGSRKGHQIKRGLGKIINPHADIRVLRDNLSLRDTTETRTALADELMRRREYEEAIMHYNTALSGIYAHNPDIMLKLAFAHFYMGHYQDTRTLLEELMRKNPDFRSQEGHLLYARTLQQLGDASGAEEEYKILVEYYSGPDARYYYARLLYDNRRIREAKEQLEKVESYARLAPKFYRNLHKARLAEIRRLINELTREV